MLNAVPLHPVVTRFNEVDSIRVGPGMDLGFREGVQQSFVMLGAIFPADTGPPTGSDLKAKTASGADLF